MNKKLEVFVLECTHGTHITKVEEVQSLWSGYGHIYRVLVSGGIHSSVILKHVAYPNANQHPKGWNTSESHNRKLKSYTVETHWYKQYAEHVQVRIPQCFGVKVLEEEVLLVLEDLNQAGFDLRKTDANLQDVHLCLQWLAGFHAQHLGVVPEGLWSIGTYWHLDTRPDEWTAMPKGPVKDQAKTMDSILNGARFQTLVHGDAKLANFCFSKTGSVAAVDFQYIGGGCGIKDVVYFIGSCFNELDCEKYADALLDYYFDALKIRLNANNNTIDFNALETEWRLLYAVAWTDFNRFLIGWSPGHWKLHQYSEKMTAQVMSNIKSGGYGS